MRGQEDRQQSVFVVLNLEEKVSADHPLRAIKAWADKVLATMRRDFEAAYSHTGRPGVPPEQLLKALLLQALYSIPSEIKLMEAIDYNLLYRWFLDLPVDTKVWTPEAFSMNRQRFIDHDLVRGFFEKVVGEALKQGLVSEDHFTVDGTLIRSLASHKSLTPIDGRSKAARAQREVNKADDEGEASGGSGGGGRDRLVDWKGQKLSNQTHRSTTDPEALLARKGRGRPAELCHSGHVLMENRHGLCVDMAVDCADGHAERDCAKQMLQRVRKRHRIKPKTAGMDTGYDDGEFLHELETKLKVTPHVPTRRGPIRATDAAGKARRRARRRSKTKGYAISQRIRKRVEQVIGWCKTTGNWARTRFLGHDRIENEGLIIGAAYNLLRMTRLVPAA
ncbi:MAG: IS5 family transposase [Phycisphaera sp.]|nr:IS5 family transposase [Phycisphaera sp.]